MVGNLNQTLAFATKEITGNEFQRPLLELLDAVGRHQLFSQRVAAGEAAVASQLAQAQSQVDHAFEALDRAEARHGAALQFTDDGLGKRQRDAARPAAVKHKWQDLKSRSMAAAAADATKPHASLVADLRLMITHVADTSNLILDPDLDSYYLMDATVTKLPQFQHRLSDALVAADTTLRKKTNTLGERIPFAIFAAQLQEELDGLRASMQTVFNEDANFYGVSPTLHSQLDAPLKELGSPPRPCSRS